ncbi:hypothetical protein V9T40_001258 [Parthenolecanium corni]|uniref:Uncharacterized protein n=1 Tax=Parthenolecanium corni TaxID=536013 RepID=A0AAN9TEM1_9HEMI
MIDRMNELVETNTKNNNVIAQLQRQNQDLQSQLAKTREEMSQRERALEEGRYVNYDNYEGNYAVSNEQVDKEVCSPEQIRAMAKKITATFNSLKEKDKNIKSSLGKNQIIFEIEKSKQNFSDNNNLENERSPKIKTSPENNFAKERFVENKNESIGLVERDTAKLDFFLPCRKISKCGSHYMDLGLKRLTDVIDPKVPPPRCFTQIKMKETKYSEGNNYKSH